MQKIHFVGIGGIGVSALAGYYLKKGIEVSGSDVSQSPITEKLKKEGAKIFVGHKASNLMAGVEFVVHTAAAAKDNPELKEARKKKIKVQSYAEALGDLTEKMYTIAVSGMHGKSTTTAMIGLVLEKAGLDPTVIVGTKVKEWGGNNFRIGQGKYLVIEADEFNASFLNYRPRVIVLTNIEEEHLDFYTGGIKQIVKTFSDYVGHLGGEGILVANTLNEEVLKIAKKEKMAKVVLYDSSEKNGLSLKLPGTHNLSNASAALAVAEILGVSDKIAKEALNEFNGTWRRMEYKGLVNGAKIYDDYGHHPTEIKATLLGARELVKKGHQLWCVFQPHQYQRTYKLFEQFVGAFADADRTIILPIYSVAGREKESIKKMVSSEKLVKEINSEEVIYFDSFSKAEKYLKKNLKKGDVCLIMGAGDIYKLTEKLV
jgi:UDP-N-acetylmuramate--alanine ligase